MTNRLLTALVALSTMAVFSAEAQEEEAAATEATTEASAEGEKAAEAKPVAPKAKAFSVIPLLRHAEGTAEVQVPQAEGWKQVEEGVFYPLGASYRVSRGGKLVLAFGPECSVEIEGEASFSTKAQPLGDPSRTVRLGTGVLEVKLADNLPEGSFFVAGGSFVAKNLAGNSRFTYVDKGDGDEVTIRCVTGSLAVDGRHWSIAQMRAADEFRVRSSHDNLCTFLSGTSGDYIVKIDRGVTATNVVSDDGTVSQGSNQSYLDWHLSPATKIRIDRMVPEIGERMSVSVMTFDAAGNLKNNFAFSEGRAEVNTGELIVAPKDDDEAADAAKKAAEATTEEAATTEEEASADGEQKSNDNNETTEE